MLIAAGAEYTWSKEKSVLNLKEDFHFFFTIFVY